MPEAQSAVDVLIITALRSELDAVLTVQKGRREHWDPRTDAAPFRYFTRKFIHPNGRVLRVAAARALEMGEVSAAACAIRLVQHLKPRTLAMCGVCAGRSKSVDLGDVIVADRLFKFDDGAAVSTSADAPSYSVQFSGDVRTYNLPVDWRYAVEEFGDGWQSFLPPRPLSMDEQEAWFLREMHVVNESSDAASLMAPDKDSWPALLDRLRKNGLLDEGGRKLSRTGVGRASFEHLRARYDVDRQHQPCVRLGAIGTSARVQRDVRVFERLDLISRRTLGVEMEGSALGAVAELENLRMIMAKGVMDFADMAKDDRFKAYAASAAAEFLLAFLLEQAPLVEPSPAGVGGTDTAPSAATRPPNAGARAAAAELGQREARVETAPLPPPTSTSRRRTFGWYLVLDDDLDAAHVRALLRETLSVATLDVTKSSEPRVYQVASAEKAYDAALQRVRSGSWRFGTTAVKYVCPTSGIDPEDTLKGEFGRLPTRNGRELTAEVVGGAAGWFDVAVSVRSTDPERPLEGAVRFYLHESFRRGGIVSQVRGGRARITITAWGSFTVGATIEESPETKLELDLGNIPGVPMAFVDSGKRRSVKKK